MELLITIKLADILITHKELVREMLLSKFQMGCLVLIVELKELFTLHIQLI